MLAIAERRYFSTTIPSTWSNFVVYPRGIAESRENSSCIFSGRIESPARREGKDTRARNYRDERARWGTDNFTRIGFPRAESVRSHLGLLHGPMTFYASRTRNGLFRVYREPPRHRNALIISLRGPLVTAWRDWRRWRASRRNGDPRFELLN